MNVLLFSLFMVVTQTTTEYPHPNLSMQCYPEQLMPGDSLYVLVEVENPHEQSIYIPDFFWQSSHDIQLCLTDLDAQTVPLLFEESAAIMRSRALRLVEIKPGVSRIIGALSINVPALEDMHEPFFGKHFTELSVEGKVFTLNVDLMFYGTSSRQGVPSGARTLSQNILLKPRQDKEKTMIEEWYKNTPKVLFPVLFGENATCKVPSQDRISESKNINVKGEKHNQWHFIRLGNRYPADPNAPETWQGWKELEESIAPSTMRDEIHLTRILIQYCDTKDAEVLEELEEWFAGMNEIQRTCMARTVREQAKGCREFLEPFRDLYKAIHKYDIADKSDFEVRLLKQQRLLE